ncbi:MAG: AAA family ATPase [Mesorhizobium sp.]
MPDVIPFFSLIDEDERDSVKQNIKDAYERTGMSGVHPRRSATASAAEGDDTGGLAPGETITIKPFDDLIGIDPSVYRQIEAALNSGKQHLMFYGPPGTGKTTLARRLAGILNGRNWTLITGSADWSSQEIIGGYQPISGGSIKFFPGVLLRSFDRPLVIDELNRCDIDKVIGPLFTVLSGQATTLPYRVAADDADSAQYVVLPSPKQDAATHEFAPGPAWRLIATINSIDKASLYQMSYALSRRFGWIFVDAPHDTRSFILTYLEREMGRQSGSGDGAPPMAVIWDAVNEIRPLGPAPVIDALKTLEVLSPGADLSGPPEGELRAAYLDVFDLFMLPLLDGILRHEAEKLAGSAAAAIGFKEGSPEADGIKRRLLSVAV